MAGGRKRVEADVRSARTIRLEARVKPVVEVKAEAVKRTFSRCDLPGGGFLMNYYYIRDARGELAPEDIDKATHYERIVFDRDGNPIGSMLGRITDSVRW